jgi:hypothetical protein
MQIRLDEGLIGEKDVRERLLTWWQERQGS